MKVLILSILSFSAVAAEVPFKDFSYNTQSNWQSFNGVNFNEITAPPKSWVHEDSNGLVQGISSDLYYKSLHEKSQEIIVAVIDSGVDVNHEDLDGKIWINKKEIPNNNIDDDNNGYVDDVMGWNFIGSDQHPSKFELAPNKLNKLKLINNPKGQVEFDSFEITRELKRLLLKKSKLEMNKLTVSASLLSRINKFKDEVESKYIDSIDSYNFFKKELDVFTSFSNQVQKEFQLKTVSLESLRGIEQKNAKVFKLIDFFEVYDNPYAEIHKSLHYFDGIANYHYNINSDVRAQIVKDKNKENYYGNNNVIGPNPFHGTHVSGIIAATRGNNIGIDGVSKNALIMPLRVVPNGDERDKDVANAIRYAVDNGAKIINMSFGKPVSSNPKLLSLAIKYAHEKDVLLIHSAGNENIDIDKVKSYPSAIYRNKKSTNWIEVGASNKYIANLFANFSNFGQKNVDIFAPGVDIISTTPNNTYSKASGTSMSSPVISGLAAIVLGTYPKLTPEQVKDVLIAKSNRYPLLYAYNPRKRKNVLFSKLSRSGAIPNIFATMTYLHKNYVDFDYFSTDPHGKSLIRP